jgi:hypothetical protein
MTEIDKNQPFDGEERQRNSREATNKRLEVEKKWSDTVLASLKKSEQKSLSKDETLRYLTVVSHVLEKHSEHKDQTEDKIRFISDVFCNLSVIRLFSTQPITDPCSTIFYMKYSYEDPKDLASVTLSVNSDPVQAHTQRVCSLPFEAEPQAILTANALDSIIIQDFYSRVPLNYPPEKCGLQYYLESDKQRVVSEFLNTYFNKIHKNSLRGPATWILCGTESINAICKVPVKTGSAVQRIPDASSYASQFKMQTWCAWKIPPRAIVFGYNGLSILDSGYVWVPLNLDSLSTINETEITVRHSMRFVNTDYYLRVE